MTREIVLIRKVAVWQAFSAVELVKRGRRTKMNLVFLALWTLRRV